MIFDLYSYVLLSCASNISTPVAFFVSLSYKIFVTILHGRTVRFPVFIAAGNVEDCVLKYPPNGQPNQHLFLNWQLVLACIGCVIFAVRPMIITRLPL